MQRAFIFANGSLDPVPAIVHSIQATDLVIAADGGSHHCQVLGIIPQVIIGDFDSLNQLEVAAFMQAGAEVLQYPSRKDETDLELALQFALKRGIHEAYILGSLGARWDMTIANILLIARTAFSKMRIHILGGGQELMLLGDGDQVDLEGQRGDILSLIPLAGDACGITTDGLEYPLKNETLFFSSTRGVSNVFLGDHAHITLKKGRLLCIFNEMESIKKFGGVL